MIFGYNKSDRVLYIIFFASAILSLAASLLVKKVALFFKIVDFPAQERKKHKSPVPLLGGLAPFSALFILCAALFYFKILPANLLLPFFWLFIGSTIIMSGGILDDKYNLPAKWQIIFPVLAIAVVLFGGIKIKFITNPAGGIIFLGVYVSLMVSFVWLLSISYTTKILDGLDGLVSGTAILGALSIFLFTTFSQFKEPSLAMVSLILAGSFTGFLVLNKYPARIFLGEGGSLFAGFVLGSLAIMTGAKIAVTLMVFALPLIDLLAVIIKRAMNKKSIFSGDRLHLHYFLVDKGWRPQTVVYLFWSFAAVLGAVSIFLPSIVKMAVLIIILAIFFLVDIFLYK